MIKYKNVLVLCFLCLISFIQTSPSRAEGIAGSVLKTMDASNYTYILIKNESGEIWAAVPQAKVKVGSQITIANPQKMDGFESKALNRKFEHIVFGTLAEKGEKAAPGHGSAPAPAKAVDWKSIKVKKAEGPNGHTVAEIYSMKKELADKEVVIRGKVTKFLPLIMKKNWVHVADGTGSAANKDFDLTITSLHEVKVGDTVLVKGKVRVDQNLGAGYFFPVMIEGAKFEK